MNDALFADDYLSHNRFKIDLGQWFVADKKTLSFSVKVFFIYK